MYISELPIAETQSNLFNVALLRYVNLHPKDDAVTYMCGITNTFAVNHDPEDIRNALIRLYKSKKVSKCLEPLDSFLTVKLNKVLNKITVDSFMDDFKVLLESGETNPVVMRDINKFLNYIKTDVHLLDSYDIETIEKAKLSDFGLYHYVTSNGIIFTTIDKIFNAITVMPKFENFSMDNNPDLTAFYVKNAGKLNNTNRNYIICVEDDMIKSITSIQKDMFTKIY